MALFEVNNDVNGPKHVYTVELRSEDAQNIEGVYEGPGDAISKWQSLTQMHNMHLTDDGTHFMEDTIIEAENPDAVDGEWQVAVVAEHTLTERGGK